MKNKRIKWNEFVFPRHLTADEINEAKYIIENIMKEGVSKEEIQKELDEADRYQDMWCVIFHHLSGLAIPYQIKGIMSQGYSEHEARKIWSNKVIEESKKRMKSVEQPS